MTVEQEHTVVELTSAIVAAFVAHQSVRSAELPEMIQAVHAALTNLGAPAPVEEPPAELKPAVPVKKSVTEDFIISLEDGRKFKSMKRYLAGLGMTPDDYRTKWGLPRDYPMVAPGYAAKRSALAKASGLGSDRRKAAAAELAEPDQPVIDDEAWNAAAPEAAAPEAVAPAEDAPAKRRGRPKKAA